MGENGFQNGDKRQTRIFCDGCYDMVHYGHANMLRQAKALGGWLVVGLHNDEEIRKHKGPPVFTEQERYKMLRAIKWVDEIVENAPFIPTLESLDMYDCDFCCHGDDVSLAADGVLTHHLVRAAGRYNYDMVHYGHANMLRQAKALGGWLVVGLHNDEEIRKHKGPPVFTEQERYKMLRAIKWVDEIVENAPFIPTLESLDMYDCDFCCHGDDVSLAADGVLTHHLVRAAGRYKEVPRTAGVSTTDLVGRMLLLTRQHFRQGQFEYDVAKEHSTAMGQDSNARSPWTGCSQFLPTTQTIVQFSDGKPPAPGDKIIYVPGSFDLFHVGHLDFLEEARKHGDYVIVGLYTDPVVNRYKGANYPIMNLHERVLSVLACKYVSEVVIGAPYVVTQHLLEYFKVDLVIHGLTPVLKDEQGRDPLALPKQLGKYVQVDSGNSMTTEKIVERIIRNWVEYDARNRKKEGKEYEMFMLMNGR